ncbi:prefoldin subunit 2, partial [Scyliorhinus canicula]|uniref:prefoldin subunit 2 n=1 Tax=Scyliorhinus canicula TaxID=7830 RepID=UPI0018F7CA2B
IAICCGLLRYQCCLIFKSCSSAYPCPRLVIDTLTEVDPGRKCYRMVGGVLVERTVREVLPALEGNKQQLVKLIENLNAQMQSKGRELNEYREKYNIRLMNEDEKAAREGESRTRAGGTGVLVS